jgi:hypothetical protein
MNDENDENIRKLKELNEAQSEYIERTRKNKDQLMTVAEFEDRVIELKGIVKKSGLNEDIIMYNGFNN